MAARILFYIFYGFVSGLAEFLPVSASAQSYLISELTAMETRHPLMLLLIHTAALAVVLIQCRHRLGHMRRELYLHYQPQGRRKRQPDRMTVLDGKLTITISLVAAAMLAFSNVAYEKWCSMLLLSVTLTVSGILVYLPQFRPSANRDGRHMSRLEAVSLGLCAGAGLLPGISRMGTFLSIGQMRGCEKRYLLDIALLVSIPVLGMLVLLDFISLLVLGFAAVTGQMVLFSFLAGASAFGGAWLSVAVVRYLCAGSGYGALAYYSWGLAMFSFILYLIV